MTSLSGNSYRPMLPDGRLPESLTQYKDLMYESMVLIVCSETYSHERLQRLLVAVSRPQQWL